MAKIIYVNLGDLELPEFQAHRDIPPGDIQEISESIKKIGVIEPLIIRKTKEGFEIVAGCVRYHAAMLAGLKSVPCIIMSLGPKAAEILKLHENVKRIPLDHVDQGHTFLNMMETFGMSEKDISECSGKSTAYVCQHISLVRLDNELTKAVKDGSITFSQARELTRVDDPTERNRLLSSCQNSGATVSTLKRWVDEHLMSLGIYPLQKSPNLNHSYSSESPQSSYFCEACHNPIKTSEIMQVIFCPTCRDAILTAISEESQRLSSKTPEKDSNDTPS